MIHGRALSGDFRSAAEACVIGSGAGGAAAAARLAADGVDVLIVEAGGYPSAEDFTQRELEMLPLLYQDAGMRATVDKSIGILQGRGVGGSTLHNTGLVYEAPNGIVDRWRREHAFPHTEKEWNRFVADATDTLGARPIPPDRVNANNDVLRRGADALGWKHRIARHNRVECSGCGYCMLGCAYNRKLNASLTYVPAALEDGARILTDARAVAITGARGHRVIACSLLDEQGRSTGRRAEVHAAVVLVAAGALDSPALLRRSGLGGGRIGRGLRLHPTALVYASFSEPIAAWRGVPQSVIVEQFASFRDDGRGGFLVLASPATAPGIAASVAPGLGRQHRELMTRYPHVAAAGVLLHDESEGTVTVGRRGHAIAKYWPNAEDTRELLRGIREVARLFLAAGAQKVWLPFSNGVPVASETQVTQAMQRGRARPHELLLTSVHPQCTCAIGSAAATSAVTPYGELWGEPDLFICDASAFPTSVGVPPQVSIMALSTATGAYISAQRF